MCDCITHSESSFDPDDFNDPEEFGGDLEKFYESYDEFTYSDERAVVILEFIETAWAKGLIQWVGPKEYEARFNADMQGVIEALAERAE